MEEEWETRKRCLDVMDLCNRVADRPCNYRNHEGQEPSLKKQSRKRHISPGSSRGKRKRRRAEETQCTAMPSPSTSLKIDSNRIDHGQDSEVYHHHARKRHNLVEQNYRQRLNAHFNRLLDILPTPETPDGTKSQPCAQPQPQTQIPKRSETQPENTTPTPIPMTNTPAATATPASTSPQLESLHTMTTTTITTSASSNSDTTNPSAKPPGVDTEGGAAGDQRRVSKGEVLDRARQYIQALEREHRRLVAQRRELEVEWEMKAERHRLSRKGRG